MRRLITTLAFVLAPVMAFASIYRFAHTTPGIAPPFPPPQFILADTAGELPSTNVREGDQAYAKDTDLFYLRTAAAWVPTSSGLAPATARYWTGTSDATLTAEMNLGALTTGLVLNTVSGGLGTPSAYAGTSCTNQFPRSLNASGAATCESVSLSLDVTGDLAYANLTAASAASKLLGRGDSGAGDWQEITLGANLTMTGTTLSATGGGGAPSDAEYWVNADHAGLSADKVLGTAVGTIQGLCLGSIGCTPSASALTVADPDVAHGMTTVVPTDVYSFISALNGTTGGALIGGLSDTDAVPMQIRGYIGTATPSATVPAVQFLGLKKDGTGTQVLAAGDLLSEFNNSGAVVRIYGDGGINVLSGGLTIGYSAVPVADQIRLGDPTFKLDFAQGGAGVPGIQWDAGDSIIYNRTTNAVGIYVGSVEEAQINASGLTLADPLGVASGGTSLTASADDNVMVGNGTTWQTKALTTCTGAGKAVTYDAATNTWGCNTISGSGGNYVEASIAVTSIQPNPAPVTVAAAWVGASSVIVCNVLGTTADGLTPEAINVAHLSVTAENRVAGVSFDARVLNPNGLEGTVRVHCTGS